MSPFKGTFLPRVKSCQMGIELKLHDRMHPSCSPIPRPDPQIPDAALWTRGRDHGEPEEELSPRVGAYAPVVVPDPRCARENNNLKMGSSFQSFPLT